MKKCAVDAINAEAPTFAANSFELRKAARRCQILFWRSGTRYAVFIVKYHGVFTQLLVEMFVFDAIVRYLDMYSFV